MSINFLMKVKDEMSTVGYFDAARGIDAAGAEGVKLVEEGGKVDDDSVSNDAGGFFVEDSGGEEMELVFRVAYYNCVACI
mmetsp:Transcript_28360/g.41201  ORF Transcript_28360/g.41201 Transcript_28360/m.41201 type:complete len:80 (-) Transcript_28360:463-702(-)